MTAIFWGLIMGATAMMLSASMAMVENRFGGGNGMMKENRVQTETQTQIQNQSQTGTGSTGEENQLRTQTREQERVMEQERDETRTTTGERRRSEVADRVQAMIEMGVTGGLGEEVRAIAREQNEAENRIQEQLSILDNLGRVTRFFVGTDRAATGELRRLVEENRVRVQKMNQLENRLTNEGDKERVRAAVRAMEEERVMLEERLRNEEGRVSLFGWLFHLFGK